MDMLDQAQDAAEFLREIDLINESERHERELAAIGACHNCEASVPPGARFCDRDCRDDYEKRRATARRLGH
jgi:hypothetical protein